MAHTSTNVASTFKQPTKDCNVVNTSNAFAILEEIGDSTMKNVQPSHNSNTPIVDLDEGATVNVASSSNVVSYVDGHMKNNENIPSSSNAASSSNSTPDMVKDEKKSW